jgi:hypothetical protein
MLMATGTARDVSSGAEASQQRPLPTRRVSERPSCRIVPRGQIWVLELEPSCGGWTKPPSGGDRHDSRNPGGLVFPTLVAAFDYATQHGLDYRIVLPITDLLGSANASPARRMPRPNEHPRNTRNGDNDHG